MALRSEDNFTRQQNRAVAVLRSSQRDDLAARFHEEVAEDSEIGFGRCDRSQAQNGDRTVKRRKHVGSSFDRWLEEEGIRAEVDAAALKAVIAWQIEQGMGERKLSKSEMARAMRTSRAALDRLLDPKNESVTLRTMPAPQRRLANASGWS